MPTESGEMRGVKLGEAAAAAQSAQSDPLPCPRCDSTSTKFCYYNNYNLSQPRHFCKSCRRYWTQGGTLRDIPVGGGSRKNSKRSRSSATSSSSSSSSSSLNNHDPTPAVHLPVMSKPPALPDMDAKPEMGCSEDLINLNENMNGSNGGFSSLLGLGGYGLGLGQGMEVEMGGFGFGRGGGGGGGGGLWPFLEVGEFGSGGDASVGPASGCNGSSATWQMNINGAVDGGGGGGGGGLVEGDCFGWPDLAISMPGKAMK